MRFTCLLRKLSLLWKVHVVFIRKQHPYSLAFHVVLSIICDSGEESLENHPVWTSALACFKVRVHDGLVDVGYVIRALYVMPFTVTIVLYVM